MGKGVVGALFAAFAVSLGACGSAGNDGPNPSGVSGGDGKFDAAAPIDDTMGAVLGCGGSGNTWTDLYRDCFGRLAPGPGCAGDGMCHGDAMQAGAQGSGGYVCGHDQHACYMGITGAGGLVTPMDKAAPDKSYLLATLRHKTNGALVGTMPKRPASFTFTDGDFARISAWIAAGALEN